MLPTTRRRHPALPAATNFAASPHAWVKLWKHHAAQPEADRINAVARERGEPWLRRYGGKISSEWFFTKALQILDEAPDVYERRRPPDRGGRLGRLAAHRRRDAATAAPPATRRSGRSATASRRRTTSPRSTRASSTSSTRRCRAGIVPIGERAGGLTERGRGAGRACARDRRSRSPTSTPMSPCRRSTVTEPGTMVAIMGTSICHIVLGDELALVDGHVRRRRGRHRPRPLRLRGRPVGGRRHLRLVRRQRACRPSTTSRAPAPGIDVHECSSARRRRCGPGESGLLALDWWNGNRSMLVDADLRGLLVGMTLATRRAGDLPRADRGDRLRHAGDHRRVRVGRRARRRDRRLRRPARAQPAADADLRRRHRAASSRSPPRARRPRSARRCSAPSRPARRPAATTRSSTRRGRMAHLGETRYRPDPAHHAVYDELYASTSACTTCSGAATTTS